LEEQNLYLIQCNQEAELTLEEIFQKMSDSQNVLGRRVSELSQSIAVQQAKIMSEKIK
jgi:hypothetical protein